MQQQSDGTTQPQERIRTLLEHLMQSQNMRSHSMIQFWGVVRVDGLHHYLSTRDQPFCVSYLDKGLCWYRKRSMMYEYDVVKGANEAPRGGVGRAFQKEYPESTPDLRLYSTIEFPLRDYAAQCGFRGYLALPLFGSRTNECYGVLEFLSDFSIMETFVLSSLDNGIQIAEMRYTHNNFIPITHIIMPPKYKNQPECEITEILELAVKTFPGLHLAQVWVPCKQCGKKSTNFSCMERAFFINAEDRKVNVCDVVYQKDIDIFHYLQASEFLNLQIDLSSFGYKSCDLSISKNPLAHYAIRGRLPFCFPVYLKSVHGDNDHLVIEFFLQPNGREDLQLLLSIMKMKLKKFKFASEVKLPRELRQPDSIECDSIDMLKLMDSYKETFSELKKFTEHLERVDLCSQQLSSKGSGGGWVFGLKSTEELTENDVIVRIEHFMKEIAAKFRTNSYSMLQFWAPKEPENGCYLETSYQPYALDCLAKGLASFRKKSMNHRYFVHDEAKEEELGPPGRVFRSGHPEITPDLFLYSTKEFWIRNYAVHCGFREYFVLPVFDEDKHKCGVLEFIGFSYHELCNINRALEAAKLHSTHIDFIPRFIAHKTPADIIEARVAALREFGNALNVVRKIPQFHMANVWVSYDGECDGINSNLSCMELALCTESISQLMPMEQVHWIHVQPKRGIIGMALASESKACFCLNLCEFSITDQPLLHYTRRKRHGACFTICLQSLLTGDHLYVVEFFLYQGHATSEYLKSFLNFLLPIMKEKLTTFKAASGKQLGEEFVVDVIEFSEESKLTSSESDSENVFPIKLRSVYYGQKGQEDKQLQVQSVSYATETEQYSADVSDFQKTEKRKRKNTGLPISKENLMLCYGMKLKDVAEKFGVGRSTIKRACRRLGITRWVNTQKQARNPVLFERESTEHLIVQGEAEKVMIKVKYGEDTIKFKLCLSLGVGKLFEEVANRLALKMDTFKIKYLDEDNDEILVTCDADLEICPMRQNANGNTCIQLFVQLIPK
ncbi:hypothetical protein C2S51_037454 [Perilla frutescens var. frutescens]|nr:hypothetical protein C2S51_037454 [Perilla frutescens var. frutescens]